MFFYYTPLALRILVCSPLLHLLSLCKPFEYIEQYNNSIGDHRKANPEIPLTCYPQQRKSDEADKPKVILLHLIFLLFCAILYLRNPHKGEGVFRLPRLSYLKMLVIAVISAAVATTALITSSATSDLESFSLFFLLIFSPPFHCL